MCVCFFYFPVYLQLCSVKLTVPWQVEQHAALGFCSDVVNCKSVPTSKKLQINRFFPSSALRDTQHQWLQACDHVANIQILLQCLSAAKYKYMV